MLLIGHGKLQISNGGRKESRSIFIDAWTRCDVYKIVAGLGVVVLKTKGDELAHISGKCLEGKVSEKDSCG